MNARQPLLFSAFFSVLTFSMISTSWAILISFDDLSEVASGSFVANGYQGLAWNNFYALNGILRPTIGPLFITNGYFYGTVSASNVAYNGSGDPAEIDSLGTNFNFLSTYLTGAWNSNLNIKVQGFRGGTLLYDTTVVASATSPTLFTFNYLNIDRLYFSSSSGEPAFDGINGTHFVMDNFSFEFVPEPSSFLLTAAGVMGLWTVLRRKRRRV